MAVTTQLSPLLLASPIAIASERSKLSLKPTTEATSNGSFAQCTTIDELRGLHCTAIKKGLDRRISAVSELIARCAEMGTRESARHARRAFELFKEEGRSDVTPFLYNSVIRGYSASGLGDEAVLLYVEMVVMGILPDKFTFPFVLSGCVKSEAFLEGVQIHGGLVKLGFERDVFVRNSLIHFYAECGSLDSAQKGFDEMTNRNVVSWTSLICGYARRGSPEKAVYLFFEMVAEGERPNPVTMVCVVSACARLKDPSLCERVKAYIEGSGMRVNAFMVNALVDMYLKCGDAEAARRIFDESGDRSLVLCNTMMSNYVHRGQARKTLGVFTQMLGHGPRPDRISLLSAISACSLLGDSRLGRLCHGYALRNGLEGWDSITNATIDMYMKLGKNKIVREIFYRAENKTVVTWNSLIAGLVRNGDLESAWRIFNEMTETDIVTWNIMIGALVEESRFEEAIELFQDLQSKGVKADRVTMVEVATACGYLGALDLATWIETFVSRNEIQCDTVLGTALVDMFARCGDSETAMRVFNGIPSKDISAWTAIIGAMAMAGNTKQATELFNEMLRQGVKPDGVVFVALLTACSHGGSVEQGRIFFQAMKETYGILPGIVHYGCMVDLLGRAGMLNEAIDLIKSMPIEPNDVIWASFLGACRTHKNVEMAAYAEERVKASTPERSGVQVLLSNIYASVGNWDAVAKVRLDLKTRGIGKIPGTSLVEIAGTIHEFTSGDDSHPERSDIESMLGEINRRLKHEYVPDLTNVLLNVDDSEKEYLLHRHSEKLAISFALIGTERGRAIRIVKNLRMCSDCHSFAKLVSQTYGREIIVRDNRRFHFFRDGVCSCSDYW